MAIECDKGTMVFRSVASSSSVVRSPEELAAQQIWVHPAVMVRNWGEDAPERYMRSLRESGKMGIVQPRKPFEPE